MNRYIAVMVLLAFMAGCLTNNASAPNASSTYGSCGQYAQFNVCRTYIEGYGNCTFAEEWQRAMTLVGCK